MEENKNSDKTGTNKTKKGEKKKKKENTIQVEALFPSSNWNTQTITTCLYPIRLTVFNQHVISIKEKEINKDNKVKGVYQSGE